MDPSSEESFPGWEQTDAGKSSWSPAGPAEPRPSPTAPPGEDRGTRGSSAWYRQENTATHGRERAGIGEDWDPLRSTTMASYVDNSFRQAVMMNPAERTQQVGGVLLTRVGGLVCATLG